MPKLTVKGQVTIPQRVRERYGLAPHTEVHFVEEHGRVYLTPASQSALKSDRFQSARGTATTNMSTDEILALTRGGE
jgi:AbrB family looped-hinge helix DNA binding protein